MRRIATTLAVLATVITVAVAGAVPALASRDAKTWGNATFYLSLGDSLAQGVQPNSMGVSVETKAGYPNQLATALHQTNPTLRLVKLGCPGETTKTMINGGICTYSAGSQLAQAVSFLKQHAAKTQLVTIDIGANDLNKCVALPTLPQIARCLGNVIPRVVKRLGVIMTALRGAYSGTIIGMSYYVPQLAGWLEGTMAGRQLARAGVVLGGAFNTDLTNVYTAFSTPVADVFTAFRTKDFKDRVNTPAFGTLPLNVATLCSYTWMCAAPPVGPNEHANVLGYGVIANTFFKEYMSLSKAG